MADRRREQVLEEYQKFNDEHSYAAETAYAFLNGVTNVVSHSPTFTGDAWKQDIALLFGGQKTNMLQRAMVEARAMV